MKRMREPGDHCSDISADDVFALPFAILVIIAILAAIVVGLWALCTAGSNKTIAAQNVLAVEFNAKPLDERKIIAEWIGDEDIDPETYLMAEKQPEPLFLLVQIHGLEGLKRIWPVYLLGILAGLSFATFVAYWHEKYREFYLCSLPFGRVYGWVLFFCMFMGWPFLLGSFICMRVQRSEFYNEQSAKRQEARRKWRELARKEKAVVKKLAEQELTEAARAMTRPRYPELAHQALVNYIMHGQAKAYAARVEEAETEVEVAQDELQKAGESVQTAQRKLGDARAKLKQAEATCLTKMSRERAEADWIAIKEARGVSSIKYNRRKKRLEIIIKVRVPYEGELYDFGDYRLLIDGSKKCDCKEIRSGVKLNHSSTVPHYHVGANRFCFGSSLSTIEDYLGCGRYVEAITLIVECMHSVNGDYDAKYIPDCFRKVSVVEKAKRGILRRNKFKF